MKALSKLNLNMCLVKLHDLGSATCDSKQSNMSGGKNSGKSFSLKFFLLILEYVAFCFFYVYIIYLSS
jgi:hypothetical protein